MIRGCALLASNIYEVATLCNLVKSKPIKGPQKRGIVTSKIRKSSDGAGSGTLDLLMKLTLFNGATAKSVSKCNLVKNAYLRQMQAM
ncbi:hypothetical protein A936_05954 [Enterobacter sp. Ag1]|nr:hypothetical protein A936_05954 [Enterobacter sp. Ag1]